MQNQELIKDLVKISVTVAFIIAAVIFGPLASIWSINTLFALSIPYTFDTWCAALLLGSVVGGHSFISTKK